MTKELILQKETLSEIKKIGSADIVVGIPSYNNAETIGYVVKTVKLGLLKYFPQFRAVIINSDGGSTDNTKEVFLKTSVGKGELESIIINHGHHPVTKKGVVKPDKIFTPVSGISGKGSAFREIFEITNQLSAKCCVVVDSDLRSITPEWIQLLAGPILYKRSLSTLRSEKKFDYVMPYYVRHKYDGTITNSIVYPLTAALYGKSIRQPIGGEFGIGKKLIRRYLSFPNDIWEGNVAKFGIDIFLTTVAVAEGFNITQSFLGAKIHDPKDPAASLGPMFSQVISTLFEMAEKYEKKWQKVSQIKEIPITGWQNTVGTEEVLVTKEALLYSFKAGFRESREKLGEILSPQVYSEVEKLASHTGKNFNYPQKLWVKTIYDFLSHFHKQNKNIIGFLIPLYFGYTASFVNNTQNLGQNEAEEKVQELAKLFLKEKEYLIKRWK